MIIEYFIISTIITISSLILDSIRHDYRIRSEDWLTCVVMLCIPPVQLINIWYITDSLIYFYKVKNKV